MRVFVLLLLLGVAAWGQPLPAPWKDVSGGEHRGNIEACVVQSAEWGSTVVRVYVPEAYEKGSAFPVLYVLDGQNVFQAPEEHPERDWRFDEIVDERISSGKLQPLLVVSIDHPVARLDGYTSRRIWRPAQFGEMAHEDGGKADDYLRFFRQIQQTVEQRYRTNGDNGLVGASLGGIFALHAAFVPEVALSRVAAVSPSLWWFGRPGVGELFAARPAGGPGRLWLDMGEIEEEAPFGAQNVELAKSTADWLAQCLGSATTVKFVSYPRGTHDEASWRRRLPDILDALYGPGGPSSSDAQ